MFLNNLYILGLLGHAVFYEDETRYGVYPYAGNLSFIMRVKVKWVLCYFVIVSRPVAYICRVYLKKNVRWKAFTTAYFELHMQLLCLG